jgi:hypothetical protein
LNVIPPITIIINLAPFMDDIEFLFEDLTPEDLKSVETLSLNYGVPMDTISDMFTAKKFNWEKDNSDEFNR